MIYTIIAHLALSYVFITLSSELLFNIKLMLPKKIQWIFSKLYCFKCVSLWSTLILTGNIYIAVIVSAIAIIIEKNINIY